MTKYCQLVLLLLLGVWNALFWEYSLQGTNAGLCTAGDFTLASAAPLHAMLQEGIIDKNVKFTPVLEGFRMPEYFDWELQPFTHHKV